MKHKNEPKPIAVFSQGYLLRFCRDIADDMVKTYGVRGAVEMANKRLASVGKWNQRANWRMIRLLIQKEA